MDRHLPGNCTIVSQTENINEENTQIKYYPNPSNGIVHFEGKIRQRANYKLNIYNSLGQLLDVIDINDETINIDYKPKSKGIYYFTITSLGVVKDDGAFVIVDL